jgi:hypothetical protein
LIGLISQKKQQQNYEREKQKFIVKIRRQKNSSFVWFRNRFSCEQHRETAKETKDIIRAYGDKKIRQINQEYF